jgi:hypothetical protein
MVIHENHWGPWGWKFLHYITFQFPEHPSLKEQESAEVFFIHLKDLLPCEKCRKHYSREILMHPPATRSRTALSSWLVDLHNRINKRLKKPLFSYEQAEKEYGGQCSSSCNKYNDEENKKPNTLLKQEKDVSSKTFWKLFWIFGFMGGVYVYLNHIKKNKKIV